MIDARDRHAALADGLAEHAEAAEVGDVEHDDEVGPAQLLDGFRRPVHPGQVLEQKPETRRRGRRIGDHDVHAVRPQEVGETGLAAEAVAVGVYVGGETDPPTGHECRGKGPGGGNTVRRRGRTAWGQR